MAGNKKPLPLRLKWELRLHEATDLSPMAKLLGLILKVHMNDKGKDCWPGVPRLARLMGVSERTAQRARGELVARGYLRVVDGRGHANSYFPLFPPATEGVTPVSPPDSTLLPEGVTPMSPTPDTHVTTGGDTHVTQNTSVEHLNELRKTDSTLSPPGVQLDAPPVENAEEPTDQEINALLEAGLSFAEVDAIAHRTIGKSVVEMTKAATKADLARVREAIEAKTRKKAAA